MRKPAWILALAAGAMILLTAVALVTSWSYLSSGRSSEEPEPNSWYLDVQRYNQGVHGGTDCALCHTEVISAEEHPNPDNLPKSATDLFDYEACASCHPQEHKYYLLGAHAEVLSGTVQSEIEYPAPTCGHCHDPHYRKVLSRLEVIDAQVDMCGQCHPLETETYLEDYHGKTAVRLDYEGSASCADCHGSHQALALDQPEEAVRACRKCHPDASERMVGYLIHAEETLSPDSDEEYSREFVLLFFVQLFFVALTIGILSFFYGHTFLWLLRSLHEKLRRP